MKLFGVLIFSFCFACQPTTGETPDPIKRPEKTAAAEPVQPPKRIVSLAPSTTEILFALGAQAEIVGVTKFCDTPPAATEIANVGGLMDLDIEAVLSKNPTHVVGVKTATSAKVEDVLKAANIRVMWVPVETISQTIDAMASIGEFVERREAGGQLGKTLAKSLKPIATQPDNRVRALVVFGREPMVAAGPKTFATELLERAGAENALSSGPSYPTLGAEAVVAAKPDVVIDLSGGTDPFPVDAAIVSSECVFSVSSSLMRPGPRLGQAYTKFQSAVQTPACRK